MPRKSEGMVRVQRVPGQRINTRRLSYFKDRVELMEKFRTCQEIEVPESVEKELIGHRVIEGKIVKEEENGERNESALG